ncbi:MAG: hypothetical protein WDW38_004283 [Sanguina aurantia]
MRDSASSSQLLYLLITDTQHILCLPAHHRHPARPLRPANSRSTAPVCFAARGSPHIHAWLDDAAPAGRPQRQHSTPKSSPQHNHTAATTNSSASAVLTGISHAPRSPSMPQQPSSVQHSHHGLTNPDSARSPRSEAGGSVYSHNTIATNRTGKTNKTARTNTTYFSFNYTDVSKRSIGGSPLRASASLAAGGGAAEKAAIIFRKHDLNNDNYLNKDEMLQALNEVGVFTGTRAKHVGRYLDAEFKKADWDGDGKIGLADFIAYYEKVAHYQTQMAREGRIKSTGNRQAQMIPQGTENNTQLKMVFKNYCKFALGQGRQYNDAIPHLNAQQFHRLCQDAGFTEPTGRLTTTAIDVIFYRYRPTGARRLGFKEYLDALAAVAYESGLRFEDVMMTLGCSAHAPLLPPQVGVGGVVSTLLPASAARVHQETGRSRASKRTQRHHSTAQHSTAREGVKPTRGRPHSKVVPVMVIAPGSLLHPLRIMQAGYLCAPIGGQSRPTPGFVTHTAPIQDLSSGAHRAQHHSMQEAGSGLILSGSALPPGLAPDHSFDPPAPLASVAEGRERDPKGTAALCKSLPTNAKPITRSMTSLSTSNPLYETHSDAGAAPSSALHVATSSFNAGTAGAGAARAAVAAYPGPRVSQAALGGLEDLERRLVGEMSSRLAVLEARLGQQQLQQAHAGGGESYSQGLLLLSGRMRSLESQVSDALMRQGELDGVNSHINELQSMLHNLGQKVVQLQGGQGDDGGDSGLSPAAAAVSRQRAQPGSCSGVVTGGGRGAAHALGSHAVLVRTHHPRRGLGLVSAVLTQHTPLRVVPMSAHEGCRLAGLWTSPLFRGAPSAQEGTGPAHDPGASHTSHAVARQTPHTRLVCSVNGAALPGVVEEMSDALGQLAGDVVSIGSRLESVHSGLRAVSDEHRQITLRAVDQDTVTSLERRLMDRQARFEGALMQVAKQVDLLDGKLKEEHESSQRSFEALLASSGGTASSAVRSQLLLGRQSPGTREGGR